MSSTSNSEVLLEARNLGLDYPLNLYPHQSLRDAFIQTLKSPVDYLLRSKEVLPVLRDVSLTLKKGDRLGVLGNNGAGKTTLCRILCGMIRPKRGKVTSFGEVEAIFETANGIMPELTGRENAHLLAQLLGAGSSNTTIDVAEVLEFSELGVFLDAPFKTYSKGMQARLMLSLVSASHSDVLILDEVFDGADVFFKEKIAQRMREKIERSGAVIFVSHGPDQILDLCNRVIVMEKGAIVFDGAPQEGLNFYLNRG